MIEPDNLIYSHEDSKDFAQLLFLALGGLDIEGHLSCASRNGFPQFSIRPDDLGGLPDATTH